MDATNITTDAVFAALATLPVSTVANPVSQIFTAGAGSIEICRTTPDEFGDKYRVRNSAHSWLAVDDLRAVELVFERLGLPAPRAIVRPAAQVEATAPVTAVGDVVLVEGNPCEVVAVEANALELAPVVCPITGRTSTTRMTARRYDGAWYDAGWLAMIEISISGPVLMVATDRAIEYVRAA